MKTIMSKIPISLFILLSGCQTVKYVPKPYPVTKIEYVALPAEFFANCKILEGTPPTTNGELLQKYYALIAMNQVCFSSLDSIKKLQPPKKSP